MSTTKAARIGALNSLAPVVHSLDYSIDFIAEQVADLSDLQMVEQRNGTVNHPAWTIGHLTLVLQMIGTVVGLELTLSEDFVRLHGSGSKPSTDPEIYNTKTVAVSLLRESRDRLVAAIEKLDEPALDQPFPDPSFRDVFPTVRHALTQVMVGHTAFHVGQVSVWRRAMGLTPMTRSYE